MWEGEPGKLAARWFVGTEELRRVVPGLASGWIRAAGSNTRGTP